MDDGEAATGESPGWIVWDNDSMNVVSVHKTEEDARVAYADLVAANPGWEAHLQVFEDPT